MSDGYRNIADMIDHIQERDAYVSAVEHTRDVGGDEYVSFTLTVDVPAFRPMDGGETDG